MACCYGLSFHDPFRGKVMENVYLLIYSQGDYTIPHDLGIVLDSWDLPLDGCLVNGYFPVPSGRQYPALNPLHRRWFHREKSEGRCGGALGFRPSYR